MFKCLSDKALELCVAAQSRTLVTARRRRGLETLEWVLIAVAIVVIAFVAYQALGGAISDFINEDLIDEMFGG